MSDTRRPQSPFRPRLHTLEDRRCPSCVVEQDGEELFITGDGLDNRITIVQVSDSGLRVACDSDLARDFRGIKRIIVDTGAGNDELTAYLPFSEPLEAVRANLGAGDDTFIAVLSKPARVGVPGVLDVHGGEGNDRITVAGRGGISLPLGVTVHGDAGHDWIAVHLAGATVIDAAFDLFGDEGSDTLVTTAQRVRVGHDMTHRLDGGDGDDRAIITGHHVTVRRTLTWTQTLGAGNDVALLSLQDCAGTGQVEVKGHGGAGNDVMDYTVSDVPAFVRLRAFGDEGDDRLGVSLAGTHAPKLIDIWVYGGGGSDGIDVRLDLGGQKRGQAVVGVMGDEGDDLMNLSLTGMDDPNLVNVWVYGGGGNDGIDAQLELTARPDGPMTVLVRGDRGDDRLGLSLDGVGQPQLLDIGVDGGAGFDVAFVSRDVRVWNCEWMFDVSRPQGK
jgi:hypothetical protein